MVNKFLLPFGYVGKLKSNNRHKLPKGTKFIITRSQDYIEMPYTVRFTNPKFNSLNDSHPYLDNTEIQLPKTIKLLYGEV